MAQCPRCKKSEIQAVSVSAGATFVVGQMVNENTGMGFGRTPTKVVNRCLDCGYEWDPGRAYDLAAANAAAEQKRQLKQAKGEVREAMLKRIENKLFQDMGSLVPADDPDGHRAGLQGYVDATFLKASEYGSLNEQFAAAWPNVDMLKLHARDALHMHPWVQYRAKDDGCLIFVVALVGFPLAFGFGLWLMAGGPPIEDSKDIFGDTIRGLFSMVSFPIISLVIWLVVVFGLRGYRKRQALGQLKAIINPVLDTTTENVDLDGYVREFGASVPVETDRQLNCPSCEKKLRVTAKLVGKTANCPNCKTKLYISNDYGRLTVRRPTSDDWTTCPKCGAKVKRKNFNRHRIKCLG